VLQPQQQPQQLLLQLRLPRRQRLLLPPKPPLSLHPLQKSPPHPQPRLQLRLHRMLAFSCVFAPALVRTLHAWRTAAA
jgi:hypothetical protein